MAKETAIVAKSTDKIGYWKWVWTGTCYTLYVVARIDKWITDKTTCIVMEVILASAIFCSVFAVGAGAIKHAGSFQWNWCVGYVAATITSALLFLHAFYLSGIEPNEEEQG